MSLDIILSVLKEWWELFLVLIGAAWVCLRWALMIDDDVTDLKKEVAAFVTVEDCGKCRLSCKEWNKLMFDQGTATFERFERLIEEERERSAKQHREAQERDLAQHKELMRAILQLNSDKRDRDAK